jgi:hypothetical protein
MKAIVVLEDDKRKRLLEDDKRKMMDKRKRKRKADKTMADEDSFV